MWQQLLIDWKTAKNIDKNYLENLLGDMKSLNPEKIGVDEIAYQKGHKYLTVVRDLDEGKVICVGEGRKKKTIDLFFKELGSIKKPFY